MQQTHKRLVNEEYEIYFGRNLLGSVFANKDNLSEVISCVSDRAPKGFSVMKPIYEKKKLVDRIYIDKTKILATSTS